MKELFLKQLREVGTEILKHLEGRRMCSLPEQDKMKLMLLNIKIF